MRPDGQGPGYIPRQAVMPVADSLLGYLTENFVGEEVKVEVRGTYTTKGILTHVLEQGADGPLSIVIDNRIVIPYPQVASMVLQNTNK